MSKKAAKKKQSKLHRKMGKAPGTVIYMGNREGAKGSITVIDYDETQSNKYVFDTVEQIVPYKTSKSISWIDIAGISDEAFVENLGNCFNLNALVLEDIVNTHQRPKIDEYENYLFGVFKMLYLDGNDELIGEHVAMVLVENGVLVFQELQQDVFDGVRERIATKIGRIRSKGPDYLFFALLDAIIDNYYVILDNVNHKIELLEEEVYENPNQEVAHKIQELKKEVLKIRKWVFPVKEMVSRLIDSENPLITKDTKLFLRDAMDHCMEINDSLQIYREMSMSLMEMYMSNMSNKMNEVMKVLTIMASIFIPLTFIAGIYGMNFDNMPELHWKDGYFMALGVMFILFIGMLIYFKRKRWL